jgi:hypothetical protein
MPHLDVLLGPLDGTLVCRGIIRGESLSKRMGKLGLLKLRFKGKKNQRLSWRPQIMSFEYDLSLPDHHYHHRLRNRPSRIRQLDKVQIDPHSMILF